MKTDSPVRLTHPDKVLYSEQGITKRELAEYYAQVARFILPHVAGRPLTLVRCPHGSDSKCFYQKHFTESVPAGIRSIRVQEKHGSADYMAIDDPMGLLGLVQMGVLEIHTWGAHADRPDRPDQLVLDLDPDPELSFSHVVNAARRLRDRLDDLGLTSFVKTTGGKGLHVVLPITRRTTWDDAKEFCKAIAEEMTREDPDRYVAVMTKARRRGRIFIDYLRNGRGATAICPYSTRARPGAPVATPLSWEELGPALRSDHFHVRNLPRRLMHLKRDPWEGFGEVRQSITRPMRRELGLS